MYIIGTAGDFKKTCPKNINRAAVLALRASMRQIQKGSYGSKNRFLIVKTDIGTHAVNQWIVLVGLGDFDDDG
jgi:hypothetical protein